MHRLGFSTGALAKQDFNRGMLLQEGFNVGAIEISALRYEELEPLAISVGSVTENLRSLGNVRHISFHAPSDIPADKEAEVVDLIYSKLPENWAIVLHPDAISDFSHWLKLGSRLCIENMDQRKKIGRTSHELQVIFDRLPEARFCFDIGHAHQVDPTMTEAIRLLRDYQNRLALVHVSEVNHLSKHVPISYSTSRAFEYVKEFISKDCPLIVESVLEDEDFSVERAKMTMELEKVSDCFSEAPSKR